MVDLSEVKDKLSAGNFTARAETDGIDIGKQSASDKRELPGRPGPQPECGAKREAFPPADFLPQGQGSSGKAYDGNNSFVCCDIDVGKGIFVRCIGTKANWEDMECRENSVC